MPEEAHAVEACAKWARLVAGATALSALPAGSDDSHWHRAALELRFMAAVGPLNLSAETRARFKAMSDDLQRMASE